MVPNAEKRWKDRVRAREIAEELENEANLYERLSDLQGKAIPRLLWYGEAASGMAKVLITEYAGEALPEHPTRKQRKEALKMLRSLHKAGVLHGDIEKRNFVRLGDEVRILDFGFGDFREEETCDEQWLEKTNDEVKRLRKVL